ncbi:hypothetical protein GBA52_026010 [Prunus armeniaca]|nr:hypothetical protein GBA52_026010 [Prunus armeniaca]
MPSGILSDISLCTWRSLNTKANAHTSEAITLSLVDYRVFSDDEDADGGFEQQQRGHVARGSRVVDRIGRNRAQVPQAAE